MESHDGMVLAGKTEELGGNHFVHHKSHMD
jgi:hypothetical protein